MSQFPASPLSPFHQSLMHPLQQRPGFSDPMPQMGWVGEQPDPDAMRLQTAQNIAVARSRRGQSATSQQQGMGGVSPIQQATMKAKSQFLAQLSDLTDEEKEQYGKLQSDPNVSLHQFNDVLMNRRRMNLDAKKAEKDAGKQHDFSSLDAPAAPVPGAGTMSIRQGDGRDGRQAMSAEAMQQWQERIADHGGLRQGQAVTPMDTTLRPWFSDQDPGVQQVLRYNQTHGTGDGTLTSAGFNVTGLNATPTSQADTNDPVVQMVQSYKSRMDPDQWDRFVKYAKSGATAPELHTFGESVLSGQDRNDRQDDIREDRNTRQDDVRKQTWGRQDEIRHEREAIQQHYREQNQLMHAKHQRFTDLHRQNQQIRKDPSVNWEGDESQFSSDDPQTKQLHQQWQKYHKNQQELEGLSGELEKGYQQPSGGAMGLIPPEVMNGQWGGGPQKSAGPQPAPQIPRGNGKRITPEAIAAIKQAVAHEPTPDAQYKKAHELAQQAGWSY